MSEDNKDDLRKQGEEALKGLAGKKPSVPEVLPKPKSVDAQPSEAEEPTPEQVEESREQKRARIAQVLARGVLNDKLQAVYDRFVPKGYVGKYVLDNDDEIIRYSNLGFEFVYVDPMPEGNNVTPDGRVRVGDVVLMTITQDNREILREVKQHKMKENLGLGRKEYQTAAEAEAARGGAVPFDESHIEVKTGGG